jgi:hypothetical protein
MKAAFIEQYGGPEVLKYGDLPDPIAGPSEVVIDVVAASVNGADWKVRVGQYQQSKFPFVLVSVREHIESSESFVIQEWWPDSRRVTDVDGEEPRSVRPQRIAISERSDRR